MESINLLKECEGAQSIVISGHVRPDGDCVGSCMAAYLYLKKAMPSADIKVCIEKPASVFGCIKDFELIDSSFSVEAPVDVMIALDCEKSRLGEAEEIFKLAKKTINIDHHISNEHGCGDINYVIPSASSTSELIYDVMDKSYMDMDIAKAVYIGIVHDTGVFKYSNTSPKTLRIAAELIEYGFDFPSIIDETFYEKTFVQNQILGRALLESIMFMDGKCIVSYVNQSTLDFYNATPTDLEGIVNQLRIIKGVECAIFMYQVGNLEYKVSLRSCKYVDVSKVASYFGGGGHVRAAGCTMNGTFHDVINNISGQIEKQMKEYVTE
ncbi:MAG: bifunctional oligoribonuclease/PAP phosphatase NrnA [Lachnospiraceae bacterium]|nr:bifunctional oligoribonuclease/PAP phosphatase NrnA [Lachnospiraceae bacterium]MEE0919319.1 bifunctional oligoribonuclease/PAP phosphatase NrnA [Lachnospiraceae bacterium]